MENPIKLIYKFNKDAGLLANGYDDFLESSFQIEEALEGFNLDEISAVVDETDASPKNVARAILDVTLATKVNGDYDNYTPLADVDRLDKACDAVVFAVGSMAKLGLDPQQITKALNIVMHANQAKLFMPTDQHGKLCKPEGFIPPEDKLQLILDERT